MPTSRSGSARDREGLEAECFRAAESTQGQGDRSVQATPECCHSFFSLRGLRRFACGRHCGGARVGCGLVEVVDQDRGAVLAEQA